MTPSILSTPLAPLVCALMTASCAVSPPASASPPRLEPPTAARAPCRLDLLPPNPTMADLEGGYMARGAALVACDAARRLAVQTLDAEHAAEDRWRAGAD